MKKIILFLLAVAIGFSADAGVKKKKNSKKKIEIISVSMHRTTCYGRCPDYTIELNKSGLVTYTATMNLPDTGIFTKKLASAKTLAVINKFEEYKVDTCKEEYDNMIPDLPGIIYEIKYTNKTKKIYNAGWGPAFLKQLATEIDGFGKKEGDKTWKKIGTVKQK
jgi:hypothetical protein